MYMKCVCVYPFKHLKIYIFCKLKQYGSFRTNLDAVNMLIKLGSVTVTLHSRNISDTILSIPAKKKKEKKILIHLSFKCLYLHFCFNEEKTENMYSIQI